MDELTLKWGTLKGWDLKSQPALDALDALLDAGDRCMSAALQRDDDNQKELLCAPIDAIDNPQVYLDWDGKYVSKEAAKAYAMEYK